MSTLSDNDILERVDSRYTVEELCEELDLGYLLDDMDDLDMDTLFKFMKRKIIKRAKELDIW